jgi:hypothetical protein
MTPRTLLQRSATSLALASVLALGACNRPAAPGAAQASTDAPDPDYRQPPKLAGFVKAADGAVSLSGLASLSSPVSLTSLAGVQVPTTADGSGAWTAPLGPVSEPAFYSLAEEASGRRVEAEGQIAVLPTSPTVVLLRAGDGAEVLQERPTAGVSILAVDYDGGGGTVVSGVAPAGAAVRVSVDGQPVIDGAAKPDGRFSLILPKPLEPGLHHLRAQTAKGAAEAAVPITPPVPPKDRPYQASSAPFGWRIDWITAGGGAQTTLLLGG